MPVSPTYPGVYIEEVPSGVHTLTGVSTAITAFVGYTPRGKVDEPKQIFNFGDYERAFDGLAVDSPLSYAVKQFYENGGGEAYVVRVAKGARPATVTLRSGTSNADSQVLEVSAESAGTWGNTLQVDVDYAAANPSNQFNLTVTEFIEQSGTSIPGRVEVFRNLSMNRFDSGYVETVVNARSGLVRVARSATVTINGQGTSRGGPIKQADVDKLLAAPNTTPPNRVAASIDGGAIVEVSFASPAAGTAFAAAVTQIGDQIAAALSSKLGVTVENKTGAVTAAPASLSFRVPAGERSSIRFYDAGQSSASGILKLGSANGGVEVDAAADFRPAQTGTTGATAVTEQGLPAAGSVTVDVFRGAVSAPTASAKISLWTVAPSSPDEVLKKVQDGLKSSTVSEISAATVSIVGGRLRVVGDPREPQVSFGFADASGTDTTATKLGLTAAGARNFTRYTPGAAATALAQVSGQTGSNGTAPTQSELTGKLSAKTGVYALEKVDLFNLLVMPDAAADSSVLSEAIAYCIRRRAFVIIDAPETVTTFDAAKTWIDDPNTAKLRSRNSALYFPRLLQADPLMNNAVRPFPAAGALAGLYARTDGGPGVWKAPAGIGATLMSVDGLTLTLTDQENGVLNPKGLNCLRTFPRLGSVSWGARTGWGDDARADEYKYIPVRRLALFLEESLYRGTQWAVFEPNDEPLWSQIRLNLGAFMQGLFRQGAFQGRTPKDAYFVKCDSETTTQNDINLGRVNLVVGFAPLKPAEFVIIKIQQIVGAIQT